MRADADADSAQAESCPKARSSGDRPELCRDRVADEGEPHPKSGCQVPGCEPLTGLQVVTGDHGRLGSVGVHFAA